MSTAGAELATAGMPWCSATQRRLYPRRSTTRAIVIVSCNALAGVDPDATVARSSTERGIMPGTTPQGVPDFPGTHSPAGTDQTGPGAPDEAADCAHWAA